MAAPISPRAVVGTTAALSFILLGNAITQSFMSVPALLVDFPLPSSPDHAARTRLLGRQWPVFWAVGNLFFRPISTFGILGYGYAAWAAAKFPSTSSVVPKSLGDWRVYALAAGCHFVTVVHSAMNIQPINEKLSGLKNPGSRRVEPVLAENYARTWIKYNTVRLIMPLFSGTVAMWEMIRNI